MRLYLTNPAGLGDRVRDLATRETACCSFFNFEIRGNNDDLLLQVSVPPEWRDILSAMADRAEELAAVCSCRDPVSSSSG